MTDEEFWGVIDRFDWDQTGDDNRVIAPAVSYLSSQGREAVISFEDILAEKLYALDTLAHARHIGENAWRPKKHFSPDLFLYARCVVIANGNSLFEQVRAHPEDFPQDMEFEGLLYVAPQAWEALTGEEFDHVSPVSYESFSNKAGWPSDTM